MSQSGQAYLAPRLGLATSPAQRRWGCSTAASRANWATRLGRDVAKFRRGLARPVHPGHPGSLPVAWLFSQPPLTSAEEPLPLAPPQRSLTAELGQGSALTERHRKYLGYEQQSREKATGPGSCHRGASSAAQEGPEVTVKICRWTQSSCRICWGEGNILFQGRGREKSPVHPIPHRRWHWCPRENWPWL